MSNWESKKPGDVIDAPICGHATLVRHAAQSGIVGVEVMHADGKPRYLNYVDLDLTAEELTEIRNARINHNLIF